MARLLGVTLDLRLLAFASAAAFVSLLLSGLLPALLMLRKGNSVGMQTRSHHVVGDRAGRKPRQALVISETALSVALPSVPDCCSTASCCYAKLPWDSIPTRPLRHGMESPTSYQTSVQESSFYETLLDRVKAIPDVQSVAITTMLPVEEQARHNPFSIEGRAWQPTGHDQGPAIREQSSRQRRLFPKPPYSLEAGTLAHRRRSRRHPARRRHQRNAGARILAQRGSHR